MTELAKTSQAELDHYAASLNQAPFMQHFGFRISYPNGDRVVVTLDEVLPAHRGGMGTDAVNGGVLAAMFDYALGNTAMLAPPLRRNATVQLSMTFERAARGTSLRCEAQIDRAASRMLFSSAKITDSDGTVCARATAIVHMGKEASVQDWAASVGKTYGAKE
jgi:acyl-coenzyme A thioesterase PaaI-like protein